jgi:O-antigen/teichoic acid export membrane protein
MAVNPRGRLARGLLALALTTFLATLPITVLQVWYARREGSWARIERRSIDLTIVKNFFSYSVYSFLTSLADMLRFQIDPLVISGFVGLAAVTHYKVAGVFVQYYMWIVIFSVGILQPVLSRLHGAGDHAALERIFFFGTKLSTCISVFICIALIAWGKPFIARWMGVRYEDAYWPLVVLSLAVLLDVCQKSSVDLLYATFKHRFYTYMNWAEGILNLVFSLILARPLGIVGVAMGTLIGAVVIRLVVQPWWVCRVTGVHYGRYARFLGKNLLYCCFLGAAAVGAAWWGLRPSYPYLIASAIFATTVYALGSWSIVFDRHERERLLASIVARRSPQVEPAAVAEPV